MKHLEPILVSPTTPIIKAIEIIDDSVGKIALIVDEFGRLKGTVTDGDVRRGLLKGVSLNGPISLIMNPRPRSSSPDKPREVLMEMMQKERINQMPLVDESGRVIGIEVLEELLRPKSRSNWVVLMAGGLGSRLKPLTDDRPKPLLNVGKKPILQTILENFIEHGFKKFYVSVHYKDEMVRAHFGDGGQWDVDIQYINEKERLGTAGALSLLDEKPKEPLIVMNGDLLTKVSFSQLLDFHHENKADATMCVREYDFQVPYGVVKIDRHHILAIDEKPVHRFFVNAGIYVLSPGVLKHIPKNIMFDMPHLFEKLVESKSAVAAFPIREYWLDIGRIDDLERANGEFASIFER